MVVPIFLYASTEQINNHSDGAVSEWMMSMNNLSSNLLHEITWKNDTTYIWNNRSYSILHLMNGTAEEEINGSPVSFKHLLARERVHGQSYGVHVIHG